MASSIHDETIWARGWRDAKQYIHSVWFWATELIGGFLIGAITGKPWASLIFIVLGFLAVWICATATAPFRQRKDALKVVFELEKRVVELPAQRIAIKDAIGRFLNDAKQITNSAELESWIDQVETFVRDNVGEGEVAKLRDWSGYVFLSGGGGEKQQLEKKLDGYRRRLNELIDRADTISIRDGNE